MSPSPTLTTADGTPIGTSADLVIRANPPGRTFYLMLGGAAGLVLVVGLVRAFWPRVRRRGPVGNPLQSPEGPDEDLDSPDNVDGPADLSGSESGRNDGDGGHTAVAELDGLSARATEPGRPGPLG